MSILASYLPHNNEHPEKNSQISIATQQDQSPLPRPRDGSRRTFSNIPHHDSMSHNVNVIYLLFVISALNITHPFTLARTPVMRTAHVRLEGSSGAEHM
jgi:hypothetical protein